MLQGSGFRIEGLTRFRQVVLFRNRDLGLRKVANYACSNAPFAALFCVLGLWFQIQRLVCRFQGSIF